MNIVIYIILLIAISSKFKVTGRYTIQEGNNIAKQDTEMTFSKAENASYDLSSNMSNAKVCDCKGGTCEKKDGKLVCKCPPEYGLYPTTLTSSYCKKCDCGKGANCTFEYGSWYSTKKCICKEGYIFSASKCRGRCNPNPCKNGGTCKLKRFDIVCTCKEEFIGEYCEINTGSTIFSSTITEIPIKTTLFSSTQNNITLPSISTNLSLSTLMTIVTDINSTMFTSTTYEEEIYENSTSKLDDMTTLNSTFINLVTDTIATINYTTMFNTTTQEDEIYGNSTTKFDDITTVNNASITLITNLSTTTNYTTIFNATTEEDDIYPQNSTNSYDMTTLNNTSINLVTDTSFTINYTTMFTATTQEDEVYPNSSTKLYDMTTLSNTPDGVTGSTSVSVTSVSGLCTENPCKNGGICQMEGRQKKCYCKSPYTGEFCEIDPCTINLCRNGGTCRVQNVTFYCNCDAPFYGQFCENDPCSENTCQNGGSCFIRKNTFMCDCQKPYFGITCESDSTNHRNTLIIAVLATSVVFLAVFSICQISAREFKR